MYYLSSYFDAWLIQRTGDDWFLLGPFMNESDATFICEMLNDGKLGIGESYGKKDIKDPNTVY